MPAVQRKTPAWWRSNHHSRARLAVKRGVHRPFNKLQLREYMCTGHVGVACVAFVHVWVAMHHSAV